MKRWLVFGNHVLAKSDACRRAIASCSSCAPAGAAARRTSGRSTSLIGAHVGITDDEIAPHRRGARRAGLGSDSTRCSCARPTSSTTTQCLSDATYRAIAERYDEQQLLDLVFTVGQYHLVSMALNTFRVERDDGVTDVPDSSSLSNRDAPSTARTEHVHPCLQAADRT